MNIKNIFLGALVALASVSASAQEQQAKTVEVFNPHWYMQGQFGMQHTLGEVGFGSLVSPNAQIAFGYEFNPVVGIRLGVNAWKSKGGSTLFNQEYKWAWNYIAPTLDVTANLSNLICGYKYNRPINIYAFLGAGINIAWNNDQAWNVWNQVNSTVLPDCPEYMEYLWSGTKSRFVAQFGLLADVRINDAFSVNFEVSANPTSDKYNSKKAGNADWYFNGLVGLRYNFGATHKTKVLEPCCKPVVEQPKPDTVFVQPQAPVVEQPKREPLRRDIYFLIRGSQISAQEMAKVVEVAEYMKKYPESRVSITGYADRGTGNPRINMGYSQKRAESVANTLQNQFGIPASRMTVSAKGDTEQPYTDQPLNRVTICIAE
jgi:outer membrane protein OmpA-like peptidoglycan-associated protein